jgi:hypothetical protein
MQKTSILDPMSAMATEDETLEAHRPTIKRLHAALANCLELFSTDDRNGVSLWLKVKI